METFKMKQKLKIFEVFKDRNVQKGLAITLERKKVIVI